MYVPGRLHLKLSRHSVNIYERDALRFLKPVLLLYVEHVRRVRSLVSSSFAESIPGESDLQDTPVADWPGSCLSLYRRQYLKPHRGLYAGCITNKQFHRSP